MNRSLLTTGLLLLVCATALVVGLFKMALGTPSKDNGGEVPPFLGELFQSSGEPSKEGIAVVEVSGVIQFGTEEISPFASLQPTAENVASRLRKLRSQQKVKAIVLKVNSPGGSLAASQAVYDEVKQTVDSGKPVVVSMGDVAASGGYYISAPATKIVAYPGTITGSIGVIMAGLNLKGLMEQHGVKMQAYRSGKNKDIMAYWRDARPDEEELLNTMISEAYQQFVTVVSQDREIPMQELAPYADGRILLGSQAKEIKLVDQLGTFRDALRLAAELGGLDPENPPLIEGPDNFLQKMSLSLGSALSMALRQQRVSPLPALPGAQPTTSIGATTLPISYLYMPQLVPAQVLP